MARRDYVQGRKLRAYIAQEAADESLTDKLAQLYMSSVGKAPEYAYDTVSKKLQPKVEPAAPSVNAPPKGRFAENLRNQARTSPDTPGATPMEFFDAQVEEDAKRVKSYRAEKFKSGSYGDAKKMAERDARKYVEDYQKRARSDKVNANRVLSSDQEEQATKKVVARLMSGFKRDRKDSVVSAKPEPKRSRSRQLNYDDAEEAEDEAEAEEKMSANERLREQELMKQNPGLRSQYQNLAKTEFISKSNYDRESFYKRVKREFRANVDLRNGDTYFKDFIRPPNLSKPNDKKTFDAYKKKLTLALNKAFPIK